MSKSAYYQPDDKTSAELPQDALEGQVSDESYAAEERKDNARIPVLKDDANVKDPINPNEVDSGKQLGEILNVQIFSSKIACEYPIKSPRGSYTEPTNEDLDLTEGS
ncbi:hypothetical protein F5Y13DRAFT_185973 [Hypoxylon sp. FL1857]|nr:hypothetical protein F5Y13DRAFT_185973 [Hypoxylon sp. FL1857]